MAEHWIKDAIKHPGALRKELHVKEGEKIPKRKLEKAAKKGGKEGRRARLAETLEGMHRHHAGRAEHESKRARKHHAKGHSHGEHHGRHEGGEERREGMRSYEREMDREDKRSTLTKPAPRGPVPHYSGMERGNHKMDRHDARHIKVTRG